MCVLNDLKCTLRLVETKLKALATRIPSSAGVGRKAVLLH